MDNEDCTTETEVEVCSSEDIYGDLESDIFLIPPKKPRIDNPIQNEQYQNLLEEVTKLRGKVKILERENKNYASNISSLFRTAKTEIEKKNFTIKTLSERLKNLTQTKSKLSKEAAEEIISRCQEALLESQAQITLEEIHKSLKLNEISSNTPRKKTRERKRFKFGNMSLYFFQEQIDFRRDETVTFPQPDRTCQPTDQGGSESIDQVKSNCEDKQSHLEGKINERCKSSSQNESVNARDDGHDEGADPRRNPNVLSTLQEENRTSDNKRRTSFERDRDKPISYKGNNSSERNHRRNSKDDSPATSDRQNNRNEDGRHRSSFNRKEVDARKFERDRRPPYNWKSDNHGRPSREYRGNSRYSNYNGRRHFNTSDHRSRSRSR